VLDIDNKETFADQIGCAILFPRWAQSGSTVLRRAAPRVGLTGHGRGASSGQSIADGAVLVKEVLAGEHGRMTTGPGELGV
jgi:hypothetical protein